MSNSAKHKSRGHRLAAADKAIRPAMTADTPAPVPDSASPKRMITIPDLSRLDLMGLREPPADEIECLELGMGIDVELMRLLEEELPPDERVAFHTDSPSDSMMSRYDELVIKQAAELGGYICMSPSVQLRIVEWSQASDRGPRLLMRFAKALGTRNRTIHEKGKLPVTDPRWYLNKQQAVKELRILFRQYKNTFNPRRQSPSQEEVCEWFRLTIHNSAEAFVFLRINVESLIAYLGYVRTYDETRSRRISLGLVKPAELFDAWGAWSRNLSEDTFRQRISSLSGSKL